LLTFFRATTQIAFGRNCAQPFWNPGRNTTN
jgi:hypothetical protein